LKAIGHSLKTLGPSQKTLRHPWCPKVVTGLPTPMFLITVDFGADSSAAREWFQIYCRIRWQV